MEAKAIRALTRARAEARSALQDPTVRLTAFLRRHASRYTGRANGSPAHLRWLAEVGCPTPGHQLVFQADGRAVSEPHDRLPRLTQERHEHVKAWRVSPVNEALQALRGGQCPVAVPRVAAMGARTRCESPRELMQFLGLIPAA